MRKNLKAISVRLEPQTLHRLDQISRHPHKITNLPSILLAPRPLSRSAVLRLAIDSGLDSITSNTNP